MRVKSHQLPITMRMATEFTEDSPPVGGRQIKWIGPGHPLSLPSAQKCSRHREPPLVMGWGAEKELPAYYGEL